MRIISLLILALFGFLQIFKAIFLRLFPRKSSINVEPFYEVTLLAQEFLDKFDEADTELSFSRRFYPENYKL